MKMFQIKNWCMSIIAISAILSTTANAQITRQKIYSFEAVGQPFNSPACLEDWKVYGADSVWQCDNGSLQAFSPSAGLRNNAFRFKNGEIILDINGSIPGGIDGRGETAIWLRNSANPSTGAMQRVRIVIEENRIGTTLRIEELKGNGSNYARLAAMKLPQYSGRYQISLQEDLITVMANHQILSASTSVIANSGVYLISSDGEGGWTDFSQIVLRSFD